MTWSMQFERGGVKVNAGVVHVGARARQAYVNVKRRGVGLDFCIFRVAPRIVGLAIGQEEQDLVAIRAGAARTEDCPRLVKSGVEIGGASGLEALNEGLDVPQVAMGLDVTGWIGAAAGAAGGLDERVAIGHGVG